MGQYLSDEETKAVVLGLLNGSGEDGATEIEMDMLLKWANKAVIEYAMLQNLIEGRLKVRWAKDDWLWSLTDKGKRAKASV